MVENIFAGLPALFQKEKISAPVTYYFSLGEVKKTVRLTPEECWVDDGKTVESADCVCKTSPEFFLRIWDEGYRPGLKDFMSGSIKSNKPDELKSFLEAFGKSA